MISYRQATRNDNEQLIALTSSAGMAGDIGLRIDRKPDFFALLERRGDSKVFVAENASGIVGSVCVSHQQVYVGGEILPLAYIGDFKVAGSYRNRGVGKQLCDDLGNYVLSLGADLAFLNVSKGNTKPFSFFVNRPGIPDFDNIGIFKVHQFIGRKKRAHHLLYTINAITVSDEVLQYLNDHHRKYQLGNVITKDHLAGTTIFAIRHENRLLAIMCIADMMKEKQNVVTKLPANTRAMVRVMNMLRNLTGYSRIPAQHDVIRMMYIKYLAVSEQKRDLIQYMIHHARNLVWDKAYSFISIGLHEKDMLHDSFKGIPKLTFQSVGMLISLKNNREIINKVKQGIPFEDYSLV